MLRSHRHYQHYHHHHHHHTGVELGSDHTDSTSKVHLLVATFTIHGSQGLGLEPNKDLIRTCKDQY